MEPLPGITAFAVLFERASGARLEAAERFVCSLPQLFRGALVGCDIGYKPSASIVVVVTRFGERLFDARAQQRFDFWCARSGVRSIATAELAPPQRAAFFDSLERCEPKLKGIPPDDLVAESARLFTQLGAPPDRNPPEAGPLLSVDVGGPGWEGVRFDPAERTLYLPGLLGPPVGDEFTLALRFPGGEQPLASRATVVRGRDGRTCDRGPCFALALIDPSPALVSALAAAEAAPPSFEQKRVHPRYPVKAPVVVKPCSPEAPPDQVEKVREPEGAPALDSPSAVIEYASDQELAADYIDNLSQGGAFVRTSNPLPVGTRLALAMRLPGGEELVAPALVAMRNDKGMGVRFELSPEAERQLAAAIARISARPRRALLVDDDPVVCRMLQEALHKRGFEVLIAEDGVAGLSILADELLALDLLITDVFMPNMDGHTLIRTIRRAGGESELAIVAMTGAPDAGLEKCLEQEGADAILDKALGAELIAQAADAVLERKRLSDAS
ncbi:MAG TPA: response regulator [Anaeromyxobacteraceae bacterium]|nr:response regulator [Anaeromyxobacteraceae bacterium]